MSERNLILQQNHPWYEIIPEAYINRNNVMMTKNHEKIVSTNSSDVIDYLITNGYLRVRSKTLDTKKSSFTQLELDNRARNLFSKTNIYLIVD
jgi:hypothetical protein